VAFGVNCVFSIKYLIQRRLNDDLLAVAAAELGLIFCTIALLSGPIWARYAWNTWWNWEPRLTSTLILWLMYVGYFILRSALEEDKRRIYSAVLGIIAYLDVPIVYYAVDIWQGGLHPDRGTKWSLETTMRHTWMVALLAFIMLFTLLLIVRYRMKKTQERYEILRQRHLGEAS
jgi:heme exporter protein C